MCKVTYYKNDDPLLQASGTYFIFVVLMKSKIPLREHEELKLLSCALSAVKGQQWAPPPPLTLSELHSGLFCRRMECRMGNNFFQQLPWTFVSSNQYNHRNHRCQAEASPIPSTALKEHRPASRRRNLY